MRTLDMGWWQYSKVLEAVGIPPITDKVLICLVFFISRTMDQYTILGRIGEGAHGIVFKAKHIEVRIQRIKKYPLKIRSY